MSFEVRISFAASTASQSASWIRYSSVRIFRSWRLWRTISPAIFIVVGSATTRACRPIFRFAHTSPTCWIAPCPITTKRGSSIDFDFENPLRSGALSPSPRSRTNFPRLLKHASPGLRREIHRDTPWRHRVHGPQLPLSKANPNRRGRIRDGVPRRHPSPPTLVFARREPMNNFYIAHSGWERVVSRLPLLTVLDVAVAGERTVSLARAEEEFLKGNELCDAKNFADALGHYDRAVEFGLTDHVGWNNTGVALDSLGLHEDALSCYDRSIAANPAYEIAWYYAGNALPILAPYLWTE